MDDPRPDATDATAAGPAATKPGGTGRIQTMHGQHVVNTLMRGLLRTPLISRGIGSKLVTVYVVGRKTGRRYAVPVAYTAYGGGLLIGSPFGWGRNLRTGETVDIRLKGRRRPAGVQVAKSEPDVSAWYAVLARANCQFAAFNKIELDDAGEPSAEDLHLAWLDGARAYLLTPQ